MSTTILDLVARLGLDDSEYRTRLGQAPSLFSNAGQMIAAGVKAYVGVKAVGALVGFGKQCIETGQVFDKSMSQVAATMGKTVEEMNSDIQTVGDFTGNLTDYAKEMGRTTVFSATQASEALNFMALAGYDTKTSMEMLPNVLNLAAAGSMDLALASDMVTDTQTALGLSLEETNVLVDQMAKTSSTTNTSVSQLGDALLALGATGRTVAGGTTELNSVLGVLADNGIKGSEGGTKLRNILLSIQGKKFDKTFKALGVEAYNSAGELRALPDILADMNDVMSDMTSEEKQELISNTFNRGDMAAVNALLGTTTDRWKELGQVIEDSAGSAEKMAQTQLDNLAGDVTLFQSAFEGLQIAISDKLTPVMRFFVQIATDGISQLTNLLTGDGLSNAFNKVVEFIGLDLNDLQNFFTTAKTNIDGIMLSLQEMFGTVWGIISEIWDRYGSDILAFASSTFSKIGEVINTAMTMIKSIIDAITYAIKITWEDWGETIMSLVGNVWNIIKTTISTSLNAIQTIFTTVTALLKGDWEGVWNGIKDFFSTIAGGLIDTAREKFDAVWTIISGVVEKLKSIFNFSWELPKIKLPHFSIDGNFSLIPPSVPKFSIDWYKKAYDSPMLFTQPTVIPTSSGLKGFGDGNGGELVIGMHKLKEVVGTNRSDETITNEIRNLKQAILGMQLVLDTGATVGGLTEGIDNELGVIYGRRMRGN